MTCLVVLRILYLEVNGYKRVMKLPIKLLIVKGIFRQCLYAFLISFLFRQVILSNFLISTNEPASSVIFGQTITKERAVDKDV